MPKQMTSIRLEEEAEMQRASEMTVEQIEGILEDMDWTEIHKARVFNDYGASVVLYTDGDFSIQEQSTHYRDPDAAGVIDYLPCWGVGNIDRTDYYEGRWTPNGEGDYIEDETGGVYSEDQMLETAIEEGEWDYDFEIQQTIEQITQLRW